MGRRFETGRLKLSVVAFHVSSVSHSCFSSPVSAIMHEFQIWGECEKGETKDTHSYDLIF